VRTLTTHFLAPVDACPLYFSGTAPTAGRRTATCLFTGHHDGEPVLIGSALFGSGRAGPPYEGQPAPDVPRPDDCPSLGMPPDSLPPPGSWHPPRREGPPARRRRHGRTDRLGALPGRPGPRRGGGCHPHRRPASRPVHPLAHPAPRAHRGTDRPPHRRPRRPRLLDDRAPDGWALIHIRADHAGSGWAVDGSAGLAGRAHPHHRLGRADLGVHRPSHFTRRFKEAYGVTPRQRRQALPG